MTDTINQTGLIIRFLIQHTGKVSINFVHIGPILDIFLQMMEHIRHLDICPSMKRTFQRADTCGDGRISIRTAGRNYTDGKSRVITTSVFSLKYQQQIKRARIKFRIILFQHIQEVFCDRQFFTRMTDMQRTTIRGMAQHVISVCNNGREFGYQVNTLTHQVITRSIIRLRVKTVHFKHATGQNVHNVISLQLNDIHFGLLFQRSIVINQLTERRQLFLVRQMTGQ